MTSNNTNEYTSEQVNVQVSTPSVSSSQPIEGNNYEEVSPDVNEPIKDEPIITKKRRKTSAVWNNFEEIELENGTKKAMCLYCKEKLSTGGRGASTSHLKRHSEICLSRKLHLSRENKQTTIQFRQPTESGGNPFIIPGAKYCNEKMREIIASAIMVHERPFSIVEDNVFMWAFEYANQNFRKVSRNTARSDCLKLYEAEKNTLKKSLSNVSKVSITTDMWKSSHQVIEYMVVTGHFVDASWNLQKRVLNFVKVPPPRRGTDIANAIFKCFRGWGIENKIFSITVDNASYNDSCVRSLKENMSLSSKLVLGGKLFHVRCCAYIMNLLVQDGLNTIKDVIHNVRESVKFINSSDARLKSFHEVVELKGLKERKLILDCPTRWNSTFLMLRTAMKFKHAFSDYNEKEPHYKYAPSFEEWDKIEKVCPVLEVFNDATHVISGTYYPTSNLYLAEILRVKKVIDNAVESFDIFMSEMAKPMKVKFDKYWGECNLLMAIACVLDPRMKLNGIKISFLILYKTQSDVEKNVEKVKRALEELYLDYVNLYSQDASSTCGHSDFDVEQSTMVNGVQQMDKGMQELLTLVYQSQSIPPTKSELETYLEENVFIPTHSSSFCALEWWKDKSAKFKVLSKMAADILAVPISSVASESTFSAGGRVIDEYRASLNEQSIEALICGGDWLRNKYGLKKNRQVDMVEFGQEEIILKS